MSITPSRPRQKLKPGAVVRCRTRRYLVEDVKPPREPGADTVVAMGGQTYQAYNATQAAAQLLIDTHIVYVVRVLSALASP